MATIEIHEDDAASIRAMTGFRIVPEDIAEEYVHRMRLALGGGHSGPLGMWQLIDMLRFLGHKAPAPKKPAFQMVRWRTVPANTPVVVDADGHKFVGWFIEDFGSGVLSILSPSSPTPREYFAKNVRLADESDDLSSLESGVVVAQQLPSDEEELEYETDSESPVNQDDDEDDDQPRFTASDIGREVLVEDGDAELIGTLIGIGDGELVVEFEDEDGQSHQESYPAEAVFPNEVSPVMVLARQQMEAEQAAKEAAEADQVI